MNRIWEPVEELNRYQIEMGINYLDKRMNEEQDKAKVVEYCVMKVDLINELMLLDNNAHWII